MRFFCVKEKISFLNYLFILKTKLGFAHICLELTDRENIAAEYEQSSYPVIRIKHIEKHDIMFVKDRAGNIFKLKEANYETIS